MNMCNRMQNLSPLVFLLLVVVHQPSGQIVEECVHGMYPSANARKAPIYTVDLDLPPEQRWTNLARAKRTEIAAVINTFKKNVELFGKAGSLLVKLVDKDLGSFARTLPTPYGQEMQGLAVAAGVPLGEIVLLNIFYELFTVCTSIVAEDSKGQLYHARNLDFGLFMGWDVKNHTWAITEALRPAVVQLNFIKGGKTAFQMAGFAGYIGLLSGMKPGVFSVTINERFNLDGGYIGLTEWLLGERNMSWVSFIGRDVLEKADSFQSAVQILTYTKLLAPVYFIVGGNSSGEGVVITRARDKALDVWQMAEANKWYILETNYDHWKAPFFLDDRRTPAHKCMEKLSHSNVGISGLFDVLSSRPVLNKLTTYTALMQVNTGSIETYLQYCPEPCWPW